MLLHFHLVGLMAAAVGGVGGEERRVEERDGEYNSGWLAASSRRKTTFYDDNPASFLPFRPDPRAGFLHPPPAADESAQPALPPLSDSSDERSSAPFVPDPGHRIVDAAAIHPRERYPFLVVFNFHPVAYAKCTGSMLTKRW